MMQEGENNDLNGTAGDDKFHDEGPQLEMEGAPGPRGGWKKKKGNKKKKKRTFAPFEMDISGGNKDEEISSLVHETGDFYGVVSSLAIRKSSLVRKDQEENGVPSELDESSTTVLGILRSAGKAGYLVRNTLLLGLLGGLVFYFIDKIDKTVESYEDVLNEKDTHPRGIHGGTFGGKHNIGQPGGAYAHDKHGESLHNTYIPIPSNVGQHIPSIGIDNTINHIGHYWHDPYLSPYSSHLYDKRSDEELQKEQDEFDTRMNTYKDVNSTIPKDQRPLYYGSWNLIDDYVNGGDGADAYYGYGYYKARPVATFTRYPYRDVPNSEFPEDSWQTDLVYLKKFINEGLSLIERVKEGIYAEYGHETITINKNNQKMIKKLTNDEIQKRNELFQVIIKKENGGNQNENIQINSYTNFPSSEKGIAYMPKNTYENGLIKKLLHAIITNDEFYVVSTGDDSSIDGVNFLQTHIMKGFHYLMEPIFDYLGMRLITRNMASSGDNELINSLGGGDIYGEVDILLYDYDFKKNLNDKQKGSIDFFNRQGILTGEHLPLILTPYYASEMGDDSLEKAWFGMINTDYKNDGICQRNANAPYACKYVNCGGDDTTCPKQTISKCWIDRKDVPGTSIAGGSTLEKKEPQRDHVDNTKSIQNKYPNYNQHLLFGRKVSLLVLHALHDALTLWLNEIDPDEQGRELQLPLKEELWHVGNTYKDIRDSIVNNKKNKNTKRLLEDEGTDDDDDELNTHSNNDNKQEEQVKNNNNNSSKESSSSPSYCELLFEDYPLVCHVAMHAYTEYTPRAYPFLTSLTYNVRPDVNIIIPEVSSDSQEIYDDMDLLPIEWKIPSDEVDVHAVAIANGNPEPITNDWGYYDDDTDDGSDWLYTDDATGEWDFDNMDLANDDGGFRRHNSRSRRQLKEQQQKQTSISSLLSRSSKETFLRPTADMSRSSSSSSSSSTLIEMRRKLDTNDAATTLTPGKGWMLHGAPIGFCDGSAQSHCNRSPQNDCLMENRNAHDKTGLLGDALSGWLIFTIRNVKEGIILARIDVNVDPNSNDATKGWTAVNNEGGDNRKERQLLVDDDSDNNNGDNNDYDGVDRERRRRDQEGGEASQQQNQRKTTIADPSFEFDIAINGQITKTLKKNGFLSYVNKKKIVNDLALIPLLYDEEFSEGKSNDDGEDFDGEDVEVAIRIRNRNARSLGRASTLLVTHIYFA